MLKAITDFLQLYDTVNFRKQALGCAYIYSTPHSHGLNSGEGLVIRQAGVGGRCLSKKIVSFFVFYLFIYLFIYLSIYLFIYLFIFVCCCCFLMMGGGGGGGGGAYFQYFAVAKITKGNAVA